MITTADKMRELRERRKAAGVCIYCGDPILATVTMCERHAQIKRSGIGPLAKRAMKRYPVERLKPRRGNRSE